MQRIILLILVTLLALSFGIVFSCSTCNPAAGGGDDDYDGYDGYDGYDDDDDDDTVADDDTTDDDTIDDDTADDDTGQTPVNCALEGVASASSVSHSKPQNTPDKANDGNYLSWWENTTQTWYPEALYQPQWLAVRMPETSWIGEIGVYWGRGSGDQYEYGTVFEVYVNTEEDPEVMPHEVPVEDLGQYGYELVTMVNQPADENIESNIFDLTDDPVLGRWVFLFLWESNSPGLIPPAYSFEVAELEVFCSTAK